MAAETNVFFPPDGSLPRNGHVEVHSEKKSLQSYKHRRGKDNVK